MRIVFLLFLLLHLPCLLSGQEIPPGYEKYENEDLSYFRKKTIFIDPFLNNHIPIDTSSQTIRTFSGADTSVTVKLDLTPELESLMQRHKYMDNSGNDRMVHGFRIQLYAGLDRGASDKIKGAFLSLYPDVPVYQSYSRPTFKVRTGDFLTRTEAEMFCQRLKHHFTGAFVVSELIMLSKKDPYTSPGMDPAER